MAMWEKLQQITSHFPACETFGLTSQIRRAACSVPTNIAEGYGKGTNASFAAMVRHSRGSVYELRTLVEGARRFHYIEDVVASEVLAELEVISKMVDAFLRKLDSLEIKESVPNYGKNSKSMLS